MKGVLFMFIKTKLFVETNITRLDREINEFCKSNNISKKNYIDIKYDTVVKTVYDKKNNCGDRIARIDISYSALLLYEDERRTNYGG